MVAFKKKTQLSKEKTLELLGKFELEIKSCARKDRMSVLKRYAEMRVMEWDRGFHLKQRRRFEEVKYRRSHNSRLFSKCFSCSEKACHRHHIIPLSRGGSNAAKNTVGLCEKCHQEVHPWMKNASKLSYNYRSLPRKVKRWKVAEAASEVKVVKSATR